MKEQIKEIITRCIFPSPRNPDYWTNPIVRIDTAAETVANLLVDQVRAMAALVSKLNNGMFYVPDVDDHYVVNDDVTFCDCDAFYISGGSCDHIKAVELYLTQKEKKMDDATANKLKQMLKEGQARMEHAIENDLDYVLPLRDEKTNTNNERVAEWLGYRRHFAYERNWHLPDAPEDTPGNCAIPTPDFANDPAHYERIKARLRELDIYSKIYCRPRLGQSHKLYIGTKHGTQNEFYGASEGEVLVQCALALIEQGEKS